MKKSIEIKTEVEEALRAYKEEAEKHLKTLQERVQILASRFNMNWAKAGDMQHLAHQLREIVKGE